MRTSAIALLAVTLLVSAAQAAPPPPLKVMVTNDDGVGAPGIDAVVEKLLLNPNLDVEIIAPATNQSGSGENRTAPPSNIQVTASMTASGRAAKAVTGFPGDTSLWGILQELQADPPDLVVSGINQGQNLSAEIIPISGTVGAATWAARLGIPAFAVSEGIVPAPTYTAAAQFTADLVEKFRTSKPFRNKMKEKDAPFRGLVLNINWPTCSAGSVRDARVVAVERSNKFTGYTLIQDIGGVQTWQAVQTTGNPFASDCTSTVEDVFTDLEAFNNGFVSITPLDAERSSTGHRVKEFKFVEKLFP